MELRDREYRAVLDLVGEVHDAASMDDMRASLLPALRDMVQAEYASYNEVGPHRPMVALSDPLLPDWAHTAWACHSEQNPLLARHVRTRDSRPYQWADVAQAGEFRRTALFRELYEPLGIDHQIAFTLPSPAELTIAVALSRAGQRYSEAERGSRRAQPCCSSSPRSKRCRPTFCAASGSRRAKRRCWPGSLAAPRLRRSRPSWE